MLFDREQIKVKAAELAAKGVYIGTSSWKYEGWLGQLYSAARYQKQRRGRLTSNEDDLFPEFQNASPIAIDSSRFERDCLAEYAEVFPTVSFDGAYYKFPTRTALESMAAQVTSNFQFGFKVTGDITIKRFGRDPRYGERAGKPNPHFLNADLFANAFLQPCEAIRQQVGVLMFEFSRFWPSDYPRKGEFVAELDSFLGQLPRGWPYAIELRNGDWLTPEYFACLAKHRVTHVFNSWEAMPAVSEQLSLPGSITNPQLIAARFLLRPGRKYQEAKDQFKPYDRTHEENAEARKAIAQLIKLALTANGGNLIRALIFINNRLEGNALNTIAAVLESGDWR